MAGEPVGTRSSVATFGRDVLKIDCASTARHIEQCIRDQVGKQLHRRGAVVAVSGGIDSAVCVSLAARSLGASRVVGVLMPERDSPPEDVERGRSLCESLGVECHTEDIAGALDELGCYQRRDAAVRQVFPEFGADYRMKITLSEGLLDHDRMNYFNLTVESPTGERQTKRMPLEVYLRVVAATNMKQRTRTLLTYFHAESRNYAVVGTPNLLEYELGFFVRGGDGLADLKPIAGLYKTQVCELARHIGVPEDILSQTPTTATYSLSQTQEEFYFGLPFELLDLLLYAFLNDVKPAEAAPVVGIGVDQVERVYRDIELKRRKSAELRRSAILIGDSE